MTHIFVWTNAGVITQLEKYHDGKVILSHEQSFIYQEFISNFVMFSLSPTQHLIFSLDSKFPPSSVFEIFRSHLNIHDPYLTSHSPYLLPSFAASGATITLYLRSLLPQWYSFSQLFIAVLVEDFWCSLELPMLQWIYTHQKPIDSQGQRHPHPPCTQKASIAVMEKVTP